MSSNIANDFDALGITSALNSRLEKDAAERKQLKEVINIHASQRAIDELEANRLKEEINAHEVAVKQLEQENAEFREQKHAIKTESDAKIATLTKKVESLEDEANKAKSQSRKTTEEEPSVLGMIGMLIRIAGMIIATIGIMKASPNEGAAYNWLWWGYMSYLTGNIIRHTKFCSVVRSKYQGG